MHYTTPQILTQHNAIQHIECNLNLLYDLDYYIIMKRLSISILLVAFIVPMALAYVPPKRKHPEVAYNKFKMYHTMLPQVGRLDVSSTDRSNRTRWSIGCETLDRDYATFANYKHLLGPLGVGWARLQSGWAKCEKQKGIYDFTWLDEHVDGVIEQGMKPWLSLSYGNPIYSKHGKSLNAGIWTDEETMTAWCNYVRAIVRHYGDKVMMYEVWNEPDGKKSNTPEIAAELLIRTAEVVRKENPKAKILAFGLCAPRIKYMQPVLEIMKARRKLHLIDCVSYHTYYPNPDNATEGVLAFRDMIHGYSKNIDIFQGESGCPSILEFGHAMKYLEWSEFKQVKWVLRRMANDFAMNVPSSIFTLVDLQYPNMIQSFGMVRMNLLHKPMYKRPSYYGVQHLASLLTDDLHAVELNFEAYCNREIRGYGIANKENEVIGAMLWFSDLTPTDQLEKENVSVVLRDFDVDNLVYVEPITGYVHDLRPIITRGAKDGGNVRISGLPMWDSPIFLMNMSKINKKK